MPRPVYIIVAESFAEDKVTSLLSFFHILERIEFIAAPVAPQIPTGNQSPTSITLGMRLSIIATWLKSPEDADGQNYEHQFAIINPFGEELVLNAQPHMFEGDERPLSRFAARINNFTPLHGGVYRFESRLRLAGSDNWLRQDYPVSVMPLEANTIATTASPSDAETTPSQLIPNTSDASQQPTP